MNLLGDRMEVQDVSSPAQEPDIHLAGSDRQMIVSRLWRTADQQIAACAARMKDGDAAEAEKEARALATLAKTVRELFEIDRASQPDRVGADAGGTTDVELDQFRSELARELERLRGGRNADSASGELGPQDH